MKMPREPVRCCILSLTELEEMQVGEQRHI